MKRLKLKWKVTYYDSFENRKEVIVNAINYDELESIMCSQYNLLDNNPQNIIEAHTIKCS